MSLDTVLEEIRAEREYQDGEWGTEFDYKNTLNDWVTYIMIYMGQAARMDAPPEDQRKNMLKVVTLAVAAVESFDRNGQFAPRHYEDRVPVGTRPGDEVPASPNVWGTDELAAQRSAENTSRAALKKFNPLRNEIAVIRMAVEQLLNGIETDWDWMQRTPSLNALIQTIERLVRTAATLKHQQAMSEKPG